MAIRVALNRKTRYRHDRPATLSPQVVRLRPAPHCRTPILSYSLKVRPGGHFLNRQQDPYSNDMVRMEPGIQTCEEALRLGRGSCRDTGWVLVQVLRHLGLAARFVSGYLIQLKADATSLDGPSGSEEDFTDLHAWAEVYLPGAGWIGLDATSGLLAGEGHIPLACAADPITAAPVTGTFAWDQAPAREGDGRHEPGFRHAMSVMRIHEGPRVTRPYAEGQWRAIEALGHRIDERLREGDMRLTMGGEPTFVSVDDMEGADHRLNHPSVTPGPGVVEVGLHPAHSWDAVVESTTTLYEEAHQTRLAAEKFMLDGRHSGTGGGNDVVIGGLSPEDSPILRRPDLLRNPVVYWHNHPSLSYLLSGLFVGPTSRALRRDEARSDGLYELEIAFRQLPDRDGCPPWLVDRDFRHLLVDATGNAHRSEFGIDKLYSPDASSVRRGLVELRVFEMPPHPRMSLVQQLSIRALIAHFWDSPYRAKLVRWGTELHDRFLLPHFVDQDFRDVIQELRGDGLPLQGEWCTPHSEFRFPCVGRVTRRDVVLQLRQAIEPWHVLGEAPDRGAAARSVDSSIERVELTASPSRASVIAPGSLRLACIRPSRSTRPWSSTSSIRGWGVRSVVAPITCRIPAVASTTRSRVNAYEALARRYSRFAPSGAYPGPPRRPRGGARPRGAAYPRPAPAAPECRPRPLHGIRPEHDPGESLVSAIFMV